MKGRLFNDEENDFLRPKHEDDDVHIDFTPMIDCVVLLLGFFMVTSTLGGRDEVDVPPARHGTSFPKDNATVITIRSPESPGVPSPVFLGERSQRSGHLGEGEGSVARFVEDRAENYRHVIIKADRDVPFGDVRDVMRAVSAVKGVSFSLAVRDVKQ